MGVKRNANLKEYVSINIYLHIHVYSFFWFSDSKQKNGKQRYLIEHIQAILKLVVFCHKVIRTIMEDMVVATTEYIIHVTDSLWYHFTAGLKCVQRQKLQYALKMLN